MDLDDFIITVFCLVDEAIPATLNGQRLRKRGPQPILADSEVVTMEVVGEYLGLAQESGLFAYFRRHYPTSFLPCVRCTAPPSCAKLPICGGSKSASGGS